MISNYIICATARSGSNLLCEILSSLGFAGRPEEHLWDPEGTDPAPLAVRWPHVLHAGRGENGVFGIKLLWYQAERLEGELPDAVGRPNDSLPEVLTRTLDSPKYIYLTRRDHVRQAISFSRAIQSKQWRSMDAAKFVPQYDAAAITRELHFLIEEETTWENFFARHTLSPYRLFYEQLDSAPERTIAELLTFLGHAPGTPISLPSPQHHRQADEVTEEWRGRYQREELEQ
jgi:LPS sulfotransferase NodH